jgi:hypothetical protein
MGCVEDVFDSDTIGIDCRDDGVIYEVCMLLLCIQKPLLPAAS